MGAANDDGSRSVITLVSVESPSGCSGWCDKAHRGVRERARVLVLAPRSTTSEKNHLKTGYPETMGSQPMPSPSASSLLGSGGSTVKLRSSVMAHG